MLIMFNNNNHRVLKYLIPGAIFSLIFCFMMEVLLVNLRTIMSHSSTNEV